MPNINRIAILNKKPKTVRLQGNLKGADTMNRRLARGSCCFAFFPIPCMSACSLAGGSAEEGL